MLIILWSNVGPSNYFKQTEFRGEISPRFGTDLHLAKVYKVTVLISLCSVLKKLACLHFYLISISYFYFHSK